MAGLPKTVDQLPAAASPSPLSLVPVSVDGVLSSVTLDSLSERTARMSSLNNVEQNTAALVSALAAAPAGSVVFLPDGEFEVGPFTVSGGRKLDGRNRATLRQIAGNAATWITLSGDGAALRNLTLDGNRNAIATNQSAILTDSAPNARLINCAFLNFRARAVVTDVASSPNGLVDGCLFDGLGATGVSCDALAIRSPGWTVSDSWWNDLDDGHCIRLGFFNGDATTTPVTGTIITGCHFQNTNHVGVTCEIYAQDTTVTGCEFNDLEQAIKAESAGSTVWGITFTNNLVRTIAISTAFNLQVPEVNFSDNRCYDCGGGVLLGERAICDRNYLENVGEAAANASIVLGSGNSRAAGNVIYAAPFVGIRIAGAGNLVTDNQIDGNSVTQIGINVVSTSTVGRVTGNRIINQTGNAISFSTGANFDSMVVSGNMGATGPLTLTIVKTIAAGVIGCPLSSGTITVATEGGAGADDLDTITPTAGIWVGFLLVLRPNTSSQDPTLKHGTGNLHLAGGADFVMTDSSHRMGLMWSGSFWQELWRSTT